MDCFVILEPEFGPSMRVLIVEDDRAAADYLTKAFGEVGHIADAAADGQETISPQIIGGIASPRKGRRNVG